MLKLGLGLMAVLGDGLPSPPAGYAYLVSGDGAYLKSSDGYYLLTKLF